MKKLFQRTNDYLVQYDTVKTSTLGDPNPSFVRTTFEVKARPGVNYSDILGDVQEIEDDIERRDIGHTLISNKILTTTLTEYEDLVTALTYTGFVKLSESFTSLKLRRERYQALAKELVYFRNGK